MDRADLDTPAARVVVDELNRLIEDFAGRGLRISSWYGAFELSDDPGSWERVNRGYDYTPLDGAADDRHFPWFLYWEIAWLVTNNRFEPGQRLLDLGGCSSLFSIYMASKGLEVTAIDLDDELVANGNRVAATTGWPLRNLRQDIAKLDLAGEFDHVASVCVFEHVPLSTRVRAGDQVRRLLRPGGTFSMTFDYLNPSRLAAIDSPDDVEEQFVRPSGLGVRGNARFVDNGKRYLLHPAHHASAASGDWRELSIELGQFEPADARQVSGSNEYTFGALFLERA
jgi:2-polyprenyl-3-methyl-5-hydroxy-6-metoxy-1,4-benzoquinol methylase